MILCSNPLGTLSPAIHQYNAIHQYTDLYYTTKSTHPRILQKKKVFSLINFSMKRQTGGTKTLEQFQVGSLLYTPNNLARSRPILGRKNPLIVSPTLKHGQLRKTSLSFQNAQSMNFNVLKRNYNHSSEQKLSSPKRF